MLQTSVVHVTINALAPACLHMRAREVGADTSQVQCYLESSRSTARSRVRRWTLPVSQHASRTRSSRDVCPQQAF
jgi:hypothetical protein